MLAVAALAATAAYVLTRDDPPPLNADLERLASSDGLYTAPQIKALAGFSLSETAYAHAALTALGAKPAAPPPQDSLERLNPAPDDGDVAQAYYHALLAGAGVEVPQPTAAQLPKLWAAAAEAPEPALRVQGFAQMGELDPPVPADQRRAALAALTATAAETDPSVQRARAQLFALLERPPDAAVRRVAGLTPPAKGDPWARVDRAAAIAISAAAVQRRPSDDVQRTLVEGARASRDPGTVFLAVRALQTAGLPTTELEALAGDLQQTLGTRGAIREQAVFPMIPKAVWLVAHIRARLGMDALPEQRTVALSQMLVGPDWRDDPDSYAVLMAAANLSGLSYENAGMMAVPEAPRIIRNPPDAATWIIRGRVAADLGHAPPTVQVRPWKLKGEAEVGAVGGLLHAARLTGTQVQMPPDFQRRFIALATSETFHEVRWALDAAAGLNALGRRAEADAVTKRYAKVGCPGYRYLVSDGTSCDLEATLLALELREDVPAAERLTAGGLAR